MRSIVARRGEAAKYLPRGRELAGDRSSVEGDGLDGAEAPSGPESPRQGAEGQRRRQYSRKPVKLNSAGCRGSEPSLSSRVVISSPWAKTKDTV